VNWQCQAKRKKCTKSFHVRLPQHFFLPPTNENHSKKRKHSGKFDAFCLFFYIEKTTFSLPYLAETETHGIKDDINIKRQKR
jgi:hypothetical protein